MTDPATNPAPRWWHCDTHGPGNHRAWGCPECVREMRGEIAELRRVIEQCRAALAEELAAWDIDPPLQHVKTAHDACVSLLDRLAVATKEQTT